MALRLGSRGVEVKELQLLLNKAGIVSSNGLPLPVTDYFGHYTEYSVRRFQEREGLEQDGVAGPITINKLRQVTQLGGYSKIRKYGSDIHIYEVGKGETIDVEKGVPGKLERLSQIERSGQFVKAKANCGFFNFDASSEHLGTYIDEGVVYSYPDPYFIDMIYYKNGSTEIKYISSNEVNDIASNAYWAIGTGWCLVRNGKVDLTNASKIDHYNQRHPRTLLGQKADGKFVIAVVQGRRLTSLGVTAAQSADIMRTLGCKNAVNLDGGGSSELIVNGKIINSPTDNAERAIGSAVMVYIRR